MDNEKCHMYEKKKYQNNKVADFCIVCNKTSIILNYTYQPILTNSSFKKGSVCAVRDFPLEDLKHLFCCITSGSYLEPHASKPYAN